MKQPSATILVVDDVPVNLEILVGLLKGKYEVYVASNGARALEISAAIKPDLILLDIMMPKMDGFEVCDRLKTDPELREIPIIFISAKNSVEEKVRGFEHGAVDYVTKPFGAHELDARVKTHLELRRRQMALEESYAKLEDLERARDNLIHMIIHDMRTPLMNISSGLQLLEASAELPAESAHFLQISQCASSVLSTMVTAVLDVHRMETGDIPLQKTREDIALLAEEAMKAAELDAKLGGIALGFSGHSIAAYVDRDHIRRVLQNLLSNAVKYSAKGRIDLTVTAVPEGVRVGVTDTGRGVPEEYHSQVFCKFAQVKGQERPHSLGLGLAYCKLAVEAHGGEIGLESKLGAGSTFWFTLPLVD